MEQLALQNSHFQRVLERPRREVHRSPTSISQASGFSELPGEPKPGAGLCREEEVRGPMTGSSRDSTSAVVHEEHITTLTEGVGGVCEDSGEVVSSAYPDTQDYSEMPELVPWREDDTDPYPLRRTSRTSAHPSPRHGSRPMSAIHITGHNTSPRQHEPRPMSAVTIESHDNIEYVSLFDQGWQGGQ